MAFPPQFLDEIRARLPVSSVVGRKVKLIRRGREYVGLSPFSSEKTPSFTVSDEKGFYHCFSTQEHGDVFTFLMKTQNLSFPEAVERLAEEAGLEMPRQSPQEAKEAERSTLLQQAVEAGCTIFEEALRGTEGKRALAYLRERGLTDETIRRFRLGYAPSGNYLKSKLLARGVNEELLLETRLLSPGKDGRESFDFFRDRVMFPITDTRGRPVAFGGRVMGAGEPKYLNSPDTPLFHKGQMLFGLFLAREDAGRKKEIIVAEGYMDVIALAQAGFTNAVAPLGTALTEDQLNLLWRYSAEPILCFDGDKAGKAAALRAADRALPLLRPGNSLRFAIMPEGQDPDDVCRRQGAAAMAEILKNSKLLSKLLWDRLLQEYPPSKVPHETSAELRIALDQAIKNKVALIGDEIVRKGFFAALLSRYYELFRRVKVDKQQPVEIDRVLDPRQARLYSNKLKQAVLLSALLHHPLLADYVSERLGLMAFLDERMNQLRQVVLTQLAEHDQPEWQAVKLALRTVGYSKELEQLDEIVWGHAGFAHPEVPLAMAREGWDGAYQMITLQALQAEIEAREREAETNDSPSLIDQVLALRSQVNVIATSEVSTDEFGIVVNRQVRTRIPN